MTIHPNPTTFCQVYWWRERKLTRKSDEELKETINKYKDARRLAKLYYNINIFSNVRRDSLISDNLLHLRGCYRSLRAHQEQSRLTRALQ